VTLVAENRSLCVGQKHMKLELDRDSCVWKLFEDDAGGELQCISDEDDDREPRAAALETAVSATAAGQSRGTIEISYLVYSTPFSFVDNRGSKRVFMKAASLIDPKWIVQQAPQRWIDRVEFDPNKPSVSKEVIHNVGPRVLHLLASRTCSRPAATTNEFFQSVQHETGATVLSRIAQCQIWCYGAIGGISEAKDIIAARIADVQRSLQESDNVAALEVHGNLRSGMKLELEPLKPNWFSATKVPILMSVGIQEERIFRCKKDIPKNKLTILIYCGWDLPFFGKNSLNKFLQEATMMLLPSYSVKGEKFFPNKIVLSLRLKPSNGSQPKKAIWSDDADILINAIKSGARFEPYSVRWEMVHEVLQRSGLSPHAFFPVWTRLAREARLVTPFWKGFCKQLGSDASSIFTASRNQFEIMGCTCSEFLRVFVSLCSTSTHHQVLDPLAEYGHRFKRSERCRFAAVLEELRTQFPTILFVMDFQVDCAETATAQEGKASAAPTTQHHCRKEIYVKNELYSDYERLFPAHTAQCDLGNAVIGLCFRVLHLDRQMPTCLSSLETHCNLLCATFFRPAVPQSGDWNEKNKPNPEELTICVMCHRPAFVTSKKKHTGAADMKTSKLVLLEAWALSCCGCTYCRECFRNATTECLKMANKAECRNCQTVILAQDCFNIMVYHRHT